MSPRIRPRVRPRPPGASLAAAALALAAVAVSACGTDLPPYQRPCCVDGLYYVCQSELAYGKCSDSVNPDPTGCTQQPQLRGVPGAVP